MHRDIPSNLGRGEGVAIVQCRGHRGDGAEERQKYQQHKMLQVLGFVSTVLWGLLTL